jgi:hypothetical protein
MSEENQNENPTGPGFGDDVQVVDYFGFAESHKHMLPDGKQWIEFQSMNEGAKSRFQKESSRDLVLERQSGNARVKMDQAGDRHALIKACVTDWYVLRGGQPIPYTPVQLGDFLTLADPRIIDGLELAIRKANPWLLAEMSVKDIDKEIENLQEMRKVAEERERGEVS